MALSSFEPSSGYDWCETEIAWDLIVPIHDSRCLDEGGQGHVDECYNRG